ncbi:MAG: NAD(P)-dependent oxidoreductase [Verrucomicrobia bacterium]|nr:NAD(P)-dependent oxidoreductase [Verrucomicrobiota bacterium]
MKVTLMGLGAMGSGMAQRLLDAGFELTIFNRTPERAKRLLEAGAALAKTPREAVQNAAIAICIVADDNASRALWLGPNGALGNVKPGTILIESSTLTPAWVRELAAEAAKRKCDFLDAPVTGSKPQAEAGQLTFLVGGDAAVLDRACPVLKKMSRDIRYFGPTSSGAKVKLLNNLLNGIHVSSFAEMFSLAERLGIDARAAAEFISTAAPGSPIVKIALQRMTESDFTPNFSVRLMAKDLAYATAEGASLSMEMPIANAARKLYETAIAEGLGAKDFCAVIEVLRTKSI